MYDPRLSLETQKGLQLNLASEDPAIDSGLKAVSLLEWHSLLAHHTAPAASFEGSILLCNDHRHASPPARSESWGVVDVQVDFTGYIMIDCCCDYIRYQNHKHFYLIKMLGNP